MGVPEPRRIGRQRRRRRAGRRRIGPRERPVRTRRSARVIGQSAAKAEDSGDGQRAAGEPSSRAGWGARRARAARGARRRRRLGQIDAGATGGAHRQRVRRVATRSPRASLSRRPRGDRPRARTNRRAHRAAVREGGGGVLLIDNFHRMLPDAARRTCRGDAPGMEGHGGARRRGGAPREQGGQGVSCSSSPARPRASPPPASVPSPRRGAPRPLALLPFSPKEVVRLVDRMASERGFTLADGLGTTAGSRRTSPRRRAARIPRGATRTWRARCSRRPSTARRSASLPWAPSGRTPSPCSPSIDFSARLTPRANRETRVHEIVQGACRTRPRRRWRSSRRWWVWTG